LPGYKTPCMACNLVEAADNLDVTNSVGSQHPNPLSKQSLGTGLRICILQIMYWIFHEVSSANAAHCQGSPLEDFPAWNPTRHLQLVVQWSICPPPNKTTHLPYGRTHSVVALHIMAIQLWLGVTGPTYTVQKLHFNNSFSPWAWYPHTWPSVGEDMCIQHFCRSYWRSCFKCWLSTCILS